MGKVTHGLSNHPLYDTWWAMMQRCYSPNFPKYVNWGGRGISVWEPWHDIQQFISDIDRLIGPRPEGMTLDRRDNDGPYAPWTVRWATSTVQKKNSRRYRGGRSSHPLYGAWQHMISRHPGEVAGSWLYFEVFAAEVQQELGARPPGLYFSRINRDLGYGPGNVTYATRRDLMLYARSLS